MLKDIDMADHFQPLAQKISGLRFVGPRGNEAEMNANQRSGVDHPRSTFDAEIAFAAERAGVSFGRTFMPKDGARQRGSRGRNKRWQGHHRNRSVDLADGAHRAFRSTSGLVGKSLRSWPGTRVFPYKGHLGNVLRPAGEALVRLAVPETDTRVNVGICYDPDDPADPKRLLDEVIATHVGERLRNATQVGKYKGHPIVYAEGVGPITSPGAIWIGEAARLTNAATGRGISYAMRSACVAADVIARHERPDTSFCANTRRRPPKFALPLKTAVGFMNFVNTPAFGLASSLITSRAVKSTMRYLLANA